MRQFVWRTTRPTETEDANPQSNDEHASNPQEEPEPRENASGLGNLLNRRVTTLVAPDEVPDAMNSIKAGSAEPESSSRLTMHLAVTGTNKSRRT
jgi:hypothetical protein